jgi:phosphoribosylformimino-5-aminoimidazole carboxamide ribonucleotide (ProFAR) isomerase
MGLALTNKTIDKYFGFLARLDNGSKKKLIIKLTESIEEKGKPTVSLKDLSGAWEDSRDSDEIIKEIRDSRVNKQDNIEF